MHSSYEIKIQIFEYFHKKYDYHMTLLTINILLAGFDFVPFGKNIFFTVSYRDVSVPYRGPYRRNYFFHEGTKPLPRSYTSDFYIEYKYSV